jgi:hypothetical protein
MSDCLLRSLSLSLSLSHWCCRTHCDIYIGAFRRLSFITNTERFGSCLCIHHRVKCKIFAHGLNVTSNVVPYIRDGEQNQPSDRSGLLYRRRCKILLKIWDVCHLSNTSSVCHLSNTRSVCHLNNTPSVCHLSNTRSVCHLSNTPAVSPQ